MTRRLTDLQLERYQAEALSPEERAAVDQVLAKSPPDAEALRLLRAENAAFFVSQPPAAFVLLQELIDAPREVALGLACLSGFLSGFVYRFRLKAE